MEEQITLSVNGVPTTALYQGDFMLDAYCKLRARHFSKRDAYRQSFGVPSDIPGSTLDTRIKALHDAHPEIPRRISECAYELAEEVRRNIIEGLERTWLLFNATIGDPKTAGIALAAFRLYCTVTGGAAAFAAAAPMERKESGTIDMSHVDEKIGRLLELTSRTLEGAGTNANTTRQEAT